MSHHLDIYKGRSTDRSTHTGQAVDRPVATPVPYRASQTRTPLVIDYGPTLPGQMYDWENRLLQQWESLNYQRTAPWNQFAPSPGGGAIDITGIPTPGYNRPEQDTWLNRLFGTSISPEPGGEFSAPGLQSLAAQPLAKEFMIVAERAAAESTALLAKYEAQKKYDHRETMATYEDLPTWVQPHFRPPTPDLGTYGGHEELKLFQGKVKENQSKGMNHHQATLQAYRDSEFAGEHFKGLMEFVVDPLIALEVVPGGMAAKPAIAAARAGIRTGTAGAKIGARVTAKTAQALPHIGQKPIFDPLFSKPHQLFREINRANPGAINDPLSWSQATPNVQVANMTDVGNGIWMAPEGINFKGREIRVIQTPDGGLHTVMRNAEPSLTMEGESFSSSWRPLAPEITFPYTPQGSERKTIQEIFQQGGIKGGPVGNLGPTLSYLDQVNIPFGKAKETLYQTEVEKYIGNFHRGTGVETGIISDLNERTIGQVFPDGAPFRSIGDYDSTLTSGRFVQDRLDQLNDINRQVGEAKVRRRQELRRSDPTATALDLFDPIAPSGYAKDIPRIMAKVVRGEKLSPDELALWNRYSNDVIGNEATVSQSGTPASKEIGALRKQQVDIVQDILEETPLTTRPTSRRGNVIRPLIPEMEEALEFAGSDATRTQPLYGDKVVIRNPQVSDVFPFNKPGVVLDDRSGIELARGGTRADQVIRSWSAPEVILNLQRASLRRGVGEDKLPVTGEELEDLKNFLDSWGVDPWKSSDSNLGRFEVNPTTGDRQFIVGAFDNPFQKAAVGDQALNQRYYLTYTPGTKKYGVQQGLEETSSMIDVETGENLTKQIENIINSANDEIAKIDAELAREAIGSPQHRRLLGRKNGVEAAKFHQVDRLEGRPTQPSPRPVHKVSLEEQLEFSEIWSDLYTETVDGQVVPKAVVKSTITHRDPYDPWKVVSVADSEYEQYRAHLQHDIHGRGPNEGRKMLNSMFIAESADSRNANVFDAWARAVKKVAGEKGLPEPPTPIGTGPADPDDPVGALSELINPTPEGLSAEDAFAKYAGARGVAAAQLQSWYTKGNDILKKLAKEHDLQYFKKRYVIPEELGIKIMAALHGEGAVPEGFQELIDHILVLRNKEKSEYVQFDVALEDVFASNPNYFPRMWQRRSEVTQELEPLTGFLNDKRIPQHLQARVDDTFRQLLEKGYEPVSYNPLDIMALRRMAGVEHREMLNIVKRLKDSGIAKPVRGNTIEEGHRVPRDVGPAFEGIKHTNKAGDPNTIGQYAVPNKVAGQIELVYGRKASVDVTIAGRTFDIVAAGRAFASVPKRAILTFSGFQHGDMLWRAWAAAFTPTGIKRLAPLKAIPLTARIALTSFLGDAPRKLVGDWKDLGKVGAAKRALDETPMYDDFDISSKMIADNGWQQDGDTSVIVKEALEFTNDMGRATKAGIPRIALDRLRGMRDFWETNLFQGVYRETQMFLHENFVVPKLRKMFPLETAEQIARRAADETNIMTSSLGNWQTVFRSPALKDFATMAMFSSNETETWLRMTANAINPKSEVGSLYREYWLGYAVFLAALGNTINMITTGKPLPFKAYSPISVIEDDEGDNPWSLRFNSHFLSPVIGQGREGQDIYLDIVNQADTPFMWILNAKEALNHRLSPLLGNIRPFITKETFFGEELDSFSKQAIYAAMQNLPIGAMQTLQGVKGQNEYLDSFLPSAEEGIGGLGRGLQMTGFNVRKETSQSLREELGRREGFKSKDIPREWLDPSTWDGQASPYEVMRDQLAPNDWRAVTHRDYNQDIVRELQHRTQAGVDRGQEWAKVSTLIEKSDSKRRDEEVNLVADVHRGEIPLGTMGKGGWYEKYQDIQQRHRERIRELDEVFDIFQKGKKPPKDPLAFARYEYYEAFENAKTDYGTIDWELLNGNLKRLKEVWTPEQLEHIESKVEQKDHSITHDSEWLSHWLNKKQEYGWYFELIPGYMESVGLKEKYKEYKLSRTQTQFKKNNPEFAQHLNAITEERIAIREAPQNFGLLETLYTFGYISGDTLLRVRGEQGQ